MYKNKVTQYSSFKEKLIVPMTFFQKKDHMTVHKPLQQHDNLQSLCMITSNNNISASSHSVWVE